MDVRMALTPDDIERRQFATVRKGFSPDEVRRFLADVAAAQREDQALPQFGRLGDEVASVLESAHRSASAIESAAQAEAERVRASADTYAAEIRANAERDASERLAAVERTEAETEAAVSEIRTTAERHAAAERAEAERARGEAEAFAAAETERINHLRAETDTHVSVARATLEAEATEGRAALQTATAAERDEASARADQLVADAETQAAAVVAEAQARADQLLFDAEAHARDEMTAAEDDARQRSGAVIAHAQIRLDRLLAAERAVHDRLVAASADLRVAISRVAGRQDPELELAIDEPLLDARETQVWSTPTESRSGAPVEAVDQPRIRSVTDPTDLGRAAIALETETRSEVEPDRGGSARSSSGREDALAKMVNEAVGNALRGFKP